MTRPYSLDLRERVMAALSSGLSCREVSARFGVAVSTVVKWSQRLRRTGSVAPGQMSGYRRRFLEPHREWLHQRVSREPHITLHALKDELTARGVVVSHDTVWRVLRREGLRFKNRAGLGAQPR